MKTNTCVICAAMACLALPACSVTGSRRAVYEQGSFPKTNPFHLRETQPGMLLPHHSSGGHMVVVPARSHVVLASAG